MSSPLATTFADDFSATRADDSVTKYGASASLKVRPIGGWSVCLGRSEARHGMTPARDLDSFAPLDASHDTFQVLLELTY